VSEALNSTRSYPNSLQTTCAVVVLPTPGGPDSKAVLKLCPCVCLPAIKTEAKLN